MSRGAISFLGGLGNGALNEYHRQQVMQRQDKRDSMQEEAFGWRREDATEAQRLRALTRADEEGDRAAAAGATFGDDVPEPYAPGGAGVQTSGVPGQSAITSEPLAPLGQPDQQVIGGPNHAGAGAGRGTAQIADPSVFGSPPAVPAPEPAPAAPAAAAAPAPRTMALGAGAGIPSGAVDRTHAGLLAIAARYGDRPELQAKKLAEADAYKTARTGAMKTALFNHVVEQAYGGGGYGAIAQAINKFPGAPNGTLTEDGQGGATFSFLDADGKATRPPMVFTSLDDAVMEVNRALFPEQRLKGIETQMAQRAKLAEEQRKEQGDIRKERAKAHTVGRGASLITGAGEVLGSSPYVPNGYEEVTDEDGNPRMQKIGGAGRAGAAAKMHPIVEKGIPEQEANLRPEAQRLGSRLRAMNPDLSDDDAYAMGVRIARGGMSNIKSQFDAGSGQFVRTYTDADDTDPKGNVIAPGSRRTFKLSQDDYGSNGITEADGKAAVAQLQKVLPPDAFARYAQTITEAGRNAFTAQAMNAHKSIQSSAQRQIAAAKTPQERASIERAYERTMEAIKAEARKADLVSRFYTPPAPAKGN